MEKYYAKLAVVYSIIALVFGVFYREFTKFNQFFDRTALGFMHVHYFLLGCIFFLLLMLLEHNFKFSVQKNIKKVLVTYQIGLNIMSLGFLVRGIIQVLDYNPSKMIDASISGFAGIGHIFMGISIVLILLKIKKSVA